MIALLVALVLVLVATPGVAWFATRWRLIDVPNHRSSHEAPVPRGAGVAVWFGCVMGVAVASEWTQPVAVLVIGSSLLGLVGLADDRWGLAPVPRLAVQMLTPAVAVLVVSPQQGLALVAVMLLAATLVGGYVNAFNFMDGINGISGLQAAVVGVSLAALAQDSGQTALSLTALAVTGAAIGFLPYNAVRPMIFLGDVGSYFLGAWLAGVALLIVDGGVSPLAVVAPFLLYVLDTSVVLVKRAVRGAPLMEAHREHTYQRLVALGRSHIEVALLCVVLAAGCAALGYWTRNRSIVVQLGGLVLSVTLVVAYLALPRLLATRRGGK